MIRGVVYIHSVYTFFFSAKLPLTPPMQNKKFCNKTMKLLYSVGQKKENGGVKKKKINRYTEIRGNILVTPSRAIKIILAGEIP